MEELIFPIFRGLGQGSVYALFAVGFVVIYRATDVVNFAQPTLMVLGAYFTSLFVRGYGLPVLGRRGRGDDRDGHHLGGHRARRAPTDGRPTGVLGRDGHRRVVLRPAGPRRPADPANRSSWATRGATTRSRCSGATSYRGRRLEDRHHPRRLRRGRVVPRPLARRPRDARHLARPGGRARPGRQRRPDVRRSRGRSPAALAALAGMLVGTGGGGGVEATTAFVALKALPVIILGGLDSHPRARSSPGCSSASPSRSRAATPRPLAPLVGANVDVVVPYIIMIIVLMVRPYGLFGTPEVQRV